MGRPDSLIARYDDAVRQRRAQDDPAQRQALAAFERLLAELPHGPARQRRLLPWPRRPARRAPKGIYLWGPVGRGKTWLMDGFYRSVPDPAKERLHFHRFMRSVHEELAAIAGRREPLRHVARRFAERVRLLCLDEFEVLDIGDAMLIAGLLQALFDEGIVLVTTSNRPPDELYPSGIQRASFLPAIGLLNRHTEVVHLRGAADYRCTAREYAPVFDSPHDAAVEARFAARVEQLGATRPEDDGVLTVNARPVPFRRRAGAVVWFDFAALCGSFRNQHDYIELARNYHTLFLSDVPRLGDDNADAARRFIHLVDELYDRRVKLIVSAAAPARELYRGSRLEHEFARTLSRLREMQGTAYLEQGHQP